MPKKREVLKIDKAKKKKKKKGQTYKTMVVDIKKGIYFASRGGYAYFLSRAVQAKNIFHTFSFFFLFIIISPKGRGELNKNKLSGLLLEG